MPTDEDDMTPLPAEGSGEPDDSPVPTGGEGNIDHGKGSSNPNDVLKDLGAGSPYKGTI